MELMYCLSDDGRQELALCIFNFLRTPVWQRFCEDRRIAKQNAKKEISKAIMDLEKAGAAYTALLASVPQVALCRQLAEGRQLHLSDILEQEAEFLSAQVRISGAASLGTSRARKAGPLRAGATQGPALLSRASRKLTRAAESYRRLLTITADAVIGKVLGSLHPVQLVAVLKTEEEHVRDLASRVNIAFNKKRLGTSAEWAILVRLQYFIEAFGLRWKPYLPPHTTTRLRESDLYDLLDAGKVALELPEDAVNEESIGRALRRFVQRKENQQTCRLLRNSAQAICDGLKIRPPSPKLPREAERQISTF